jgi:hypothetical protein
MPKIFSTIHASRLIILLGLACALTMPIASAQTPTAVPITVTTNPLGRNIIVDGVPYRTSASFLWTVGSEHSITAPTPQQSDTARYVFAGWSDSGAFSHIITVPSVATAYIATFQEYYRLNVTASPTYGGRVTINPESADGYYASGAAIELTATPNSGYSFAYWNGDTTIVDNPKTVTIEAVNTHTAHFQPRARVLDLNPGGAARYTTTANTDPVSKSGYAKLNMRAGDAPYGTAVFIYKQNGVTVSETGVPASPPTTHARIFIDRRFDVVVVPGRPSSGVVDITTGIGVVNNGANTANITYTLLNTSGSSVASGQGTLDAGHQIAKFIDQFATIASGFVLPSSFQFGTLDIESDQPLSVMALRMTINQKDEPLFTSTPSADLTQSITSTPIYFAQIADGGGFTTAVALINTSGSTERGTIQFYDDDGHPFVIQPVGGTAASSFQYNIPPGGVYRLQTDGSSSTQKAGWARVIPTYLNITPVGFGVFSYNPIETLLTESGIPSSPYVTHARIYVDLAQNHNTGLAIANLSSTMATYTIAAFEIDGASRIGQSLGLQLPSFGHAGKFATQLVTGLPADFTGVLDISSTTPFSALTLRSLSNERGDFLISTFPIVDMNNAAPSPVIFPHIATGGGYTTQIILLSSGGAADTSLVLYNDAGDIFEVAD